MTIAKLINEANAKGIKLWQENGQLKFKAAKGAWTEAIREKIIANKKDIIAFLSQVSKASDVSPILPVNRTRKDGSPVTSFPLSFAQERLWFIDQLEPGSIGYNLPGAVSIKGELDIDHLQQAFNLLIARHENLRTIFTSEEGQGRQVILDSLNFKLELTDLSQLEGEEARHLRAQALIQIEAATPFDLTTGPLIRGKLFKISDAEHILMLTKHHIISDGWSMGIMIKELRLIMACLEQGKQPDLPPLDVQYLDYSVWHRKHLEENGILKEQLSYWQEKLADVPENLNLATDFPRPAVQNVAGSRHTFHLEGKLTAQLKSLAEKQGCTLYMALLAVFNVQMYRYTGQEDICLGSPIANRQYAGTDSLIGLFINTLAMRNKVQGGTSFTSLLSQVKATCLEAYKHQDTPFEKIVEVLQPMRSSAINPIFQVMIGLHNEPMEAHGQNIQKYPLDVDTSKLDLTLSFTETASGLSGTIAYKTSLFKGKTIVRMGQHFANLCRAITVSPDTAISKLEYIDSTEKQTLLNDYNQTHGDYPKHECIHHLFALEVAKYPLKAAVVHEQEILNYQQLYEKSQTLAIYLQAQGVQPDTLVGLCVERSTDMIVGMLGILLAGGAYVPLDPDLPKDRLTFMLEDSKTAIVLTQEKLQHKLTALVSAGTQLVALDEQWPNISSRTRELTSNGVRLQQNTQSQHLAYVIYTSGSTGQPKGVMIEHRMVVDYCYSVFDKLSLQDCETFAAVSTFSADLGNISLYVPIMFGKTICVFANDYVNNPPKLKAYFDSHPVDCMKITPSHFEMFKMSESDIVAPEKVLIFAGEPLPKSVVATVNELKPRCRVYNNYGPTETTISKLSTSALTAADIDVITLGKPLNNTQIYILDQHHNLLPEGLPGELYIAGDGLARGYLNQPELSEKQFIANPFGDQSVSTRSRLYRTGDLARWTENGEIEYLGRVDTQVKIRGFRIEVGEIESRLSQHSAIKEGAVIVHRQGSDKQLIAYYVAKDTQQGELVQLANDDIRTWLQQTLPDYMLPLAFISIESLPLTVSGKIDRRRLEAMDVTLESSHEYQAARNAREQQLVTIWAEVLNIDPQKVGINDNFFELGGDSIKIIQVAYTASKQGIHFDINDMFDYQNIKELIEHCDTAIARDVISEDGILEGDVSLGPIQRHFFKQAKTDIHHYNQAVLLNLNISLTLADFRSLFSAIMVQHDALRLRYEQNTNGWRQYYGGLSEVTSDNLPVHAYDISQHDETLIADYVEGICNHWQACLDLKNGPLMRWVWFDAKGRGCDQLAIIIHHLAIDGVSWRILLEDINRLIEQQVAHKPLQLSEKRSSYRNWVDSLVAYKDTPRGEEDLAWWVAQSQSAEKISNAFEQSIYRIKDIQHSRVELSKENSEKLLKHCHQAYGTDINDLLLTAVMMGYFKATGRQSLMLDLEGHGREQLDPGIDITKTLGWFTSIYPAFLVLSNPDDIGQCIKDIKTALHQIPNKGVGFSIFRHINQNEILQKMPEAQVVFNFLGDVQTNNNDAVSQYFSFSKNASGNAISLQNEANKPVAISGLVVFEQMSFNFKYPKQWQGQSVSHWQNHFIASLEAIIEHCCDSHRQGFTPDDFPLLPASLSQLDTLVPNLASQWHIQPENIQDIYPLTPLQSGLLFETLYAQSENNKGMYLTQSTIGINGKVNFEMLQQAWQMIVGHYDALRMRVVPDNEADINIGLQVILKHSDCAISKFDWRDKSDDELKAACEKWRQDSKASGLNLEQEPLTRLTLFEGQRVSYLLFEQHHIVMDGWAKNIVFSNFFKLYLALLQQRDYQLPAAARYGDYVAALLQRDQETEAAYWQNYLGNYEEKTPLPMESLAATQEDIKAKFNTAGFRFSSENTQKLEQLVKTHRLTMNTVLQFVWGLLLHLHSSNKTITFGSVSSGRTNTIDIKHSGQIVGLCINTTPTCVEFDTELSLLAQLKQMQRRESEKLTYETTPLIHIQRMLGNSANEDFFQTLFVYENYPVEQISEAEDLIKDFVGGEAPNYPLSFKGALHEQLSVSLIWDSHYYDDANISKIMAQFERLTLQLIATPEAQIHELSLMSAEEKLQLLEVNNQTQLPFSKEKCVHELFVEQVALNPKKVAVEYQGQSLSYHQLYDKSATLALYLQSKGVKPDTLVGVCMDRSLDMIVAILGILQAGGAYVPMDPDYPEDRLAYMLKDSQVALLLSDTHARDKLDALADNETRIIAIDQQWSQISAEADKLSNEGIAIVHEVKANNLAYVIYTSGSTGQPKGVMVEHQSLHALCAWHQQSYAVDHNTVATQVSNIAFDASVWEVWPYLTHSASLLIIDKSTYIDAAKLYDCLTQHKVTHSFLATPVAQQLLQLDSLPQSDLRYLLIGGDKLLKYEDKSYPFAIVNNYGPTESTVVATSFQLSGNFVSQIIGRPIANTQVYILDQYGNPAPTGVPGELHIAGEGLARGYLNRPDLTDEKFVANPMKPGTRMYKSGDLARWLTDGTIEYLGRKDTQVKIRGYRIETAEIEVLLNQHPMVKEGAVVAQMKEGSAQLVAFYIAKENADLPSVSDVLKTHLQQVLPDYMVPVAFVRLEHIPLTPNGKVDRKMLVQMEVNIQTGNDRQLPRNDMEAQLVAIWADVLSLKPENISINDNFFELGGHSLMATQVISRIRHQLDIEVPMNALFRANTIAGISEVIQAVKGQFERPQLELEQEEFEETSL